MPEVVAPQPREHGAARAAAADFPATPAGGKSSRRISSAGFYGEYHGHPVRDLQVLLPALRPRAVTWLVGDSSLDNKHWLFDARRDGSDTAALPLCAAACSKWPRGGATARQLSVASLWPLCGLSGSLSVAEHRGASLCSRSLSVAPQLGSPVSSDRLWLLNARGEGPDRSREGAAVPPSSHASQRLSSHASSRGCPRPHPHPHHTHTHTTPEP